ncbi:DUF4843 domain-containing protein [Solitalea koreensis]|uniref:DUF4843 domain-containing protein n=1 Tax=Solitalea koreensis TaxID=543615 RepID=A0A521DSI5_9SPHI|nr:DUF4843 domain-containing protein [Solitalea koreensis]SMO74654.1 protein of unknown function [Solitalea koreensis]
MKKLKYFVVALALISLASCKEDDYYLFNDTARLQFGPDISRIYQTSFNLADTLKPFTFYYENPDVKQDTVFFDIYAIGGVSSKDRSFTLEQVQVQGVNNAVAGTHYVAFNDPLVSKNYVIKAGQVHSFVPVVVLRDASLKNSNVVLKFNVVADKNFQLGEANNLWRKIDLTDRLSQPAAWNASASQYYFGKYSIVKHRFMIESTSQKWDQEFISFVMADYALLQYYTGTLKTALVNYNNAHPGNMLKDEVGDLVVFP